MQKFVPVLEGNLSVRNAPKLSAKYLQDKTCKTKQMQNIPLKRVSAIFYQIFIFVHQMIALKNYVIFVIFPLPFPTFLIQKGKWNWNSLLCHELACINFQM